MVKNLDRNMKLRLVDAAIVLFVLIVVISVLPIARGLGTSLGFGDPSKVLAHAELVRADAVRWESLTEFIRPLPDVIAYIGQASVQIALAVVAVAIGIGMTRVLFALSHNIVIYGKVKVENAKMGALPAAKGGRLLAASSRPAAGNRGRRRRADPLPTTVDDTTVSGVEHDARGGKAFIDDDGNFGRPRVFLDETDFGELGLSASRFNRPYPDYAQRAANKHRSASRSKRNII